MTKRIPCAFVSAFLCCISLGSYAVAQHKPLPRFESFQVPTPLKKRKAAAVIGRQENQTDAEFQGHIRAAAKEGPDFAGHYAIVGWSCGMVCVNMAIVDVQTGKIYDTPFVGVGQCRIQDQQLLSFRLNSRLLVLTGSLEIPDEKNATFSDGPCGRFYYVWDGSNLKLIRSVWFQTANK